VRPINHWLIGLLVLTFCGLQADSTPAAVTGTTGDSAAHENMQPSLGLNYIIALEGIYPSQNGDGGASGYQPFLGEISLFAGPFAPQGWSFANGQLLPINQNAALFSILGTTFGGNGTTNFALPDLRGRVPIGMGQGPGLTNRQLGQRLGTETVSLSEAQLPAHSHTLPTGGTTATTGSGMPHDNMQPSLGINYLISDDGVFPHRSGAGSTGGIDPYLGEVIMFAGNFAPTGWSFANGATRPTTQNPGLYSILGTSFGGNGSTYALPDFRGRTAVGTGFGPGLTEIEGGDAFGVETVAITTAQLPSHSHSLPSGGTTGTTGSGEAHENQQPSLAMNYIIALEGVVPQQNGAGGGSGAVPYIGEIALFAGNFAPLGWAFAQGQLYPISGYEALFSLIGTTYGGNGVDTFALPDLSGRASVGFGEGTDLTSRQIGGKFGVESVALSSAQMPAHAHNFVLPLAGDYNENGAVDAADYTVWRNNLGQSVTIPNDQTPGQVTTEDYAVWKQHFGESSGSGGSAESASAEGVPEPASISLAILSALPFALLSTRRVKSR